MPRRLTDEDKKLINEIYFITKNYAETARQTGFSASSVRKYANPAYKPEVKKMEPADVRIPALPSSELASTANWGDLCVLTEQEKEDMKLLRKELLF